MGQFSSDRFEISINTPSDNFVKVVSDNLAETTIGAHSKHIFTGQIDNSSFRLYRLKKFSWFDYNATEFKGTIQNEGQKTKLTADFSLIWIYRNIITLTLIIFGLIDFFLITADISTWLTVGTFLLIELLVLGQLWFQNNHRFKKDKERYFEIIKTLFGTVDIKNSR